MEVNSYRPIETDRDHAAALARVERLMDIDRSETKDEELVALASLVEAYEEQRWPIAAPDPVEAAQFRIEQLTGGA